MPVANTERNAAIIADVKAGWTYSEAAERNGVMRGVVAGVCFRAGLKVGHEPHRHMVHRAKRVELVKRRPELKEAMQRGLAKWRAANPDRVREIAWRASAARFAGP